MVVSEDKRKLAAAKRKHREGTITKEELEKEKAQVAKDQEIMEGSVAGARDKADMFEDAERQYAKKNPEVETRELQRELKAFNAQIDTLDAIVGELDVA